MSYRCSNQNCTNSSAIIPDEAAEKLEHKCFMCEAVLVRPQVTLEAMLEKVDTLPVALQILPRLKVLLSGENYTIDDIITVTQTDAALVTQIIKISNSSIYVMPDSAFCSTLDEALNRIGLNTAYQAVGYVAAKQIFQQDMSIYGMSGLDLWEISVRSAIMMQQLAPRMEVSSESYECPDMHTAYTVGLLHPIGKMLISHYHQIDQIPELLDVQPPLTTEKEKEILGFNHLDAALALMRKWNFLDEIITPIVHQEHPQTSKGDRPLVALLHVVVEAVKQFPLQPPLTIEKVTKEYRADPDLLAVVGLARSDLVNELIASGTECSNLMSTLGTG